MNRICIYILYQKKPPPSGGISYLLYSLIKNQEEEEPPWRTTPKIDQFWGWFFRGVPLPPGSWSGNTVNRKPPGGGVSFDQIAYKNEHDVYMNRRKRRSTCSPFSNYIHGGVLHLEPSRSYRPRYPLFEWHIWCSIFELHIWWCTAPAIVSVVTHYIYIWYTTLYTYRVAKTHRMPYLYRSFSAKEPYN